MPVQTPPHSTVSTASTGATTAGTTAAMSAPTPADPVGALRAATRSLHETLDSQLPISSSDASMEDYANHLRVFGDWHESLVPWLKRATIDVRLRQLIEADLRDCGVADAQPDPSSIDLSVVSESDDGSDAFCWGMAYVVEGSRLGGQVLFKRLQPTLAPHPLRYLGERTSSGMSWPQFMASLRQHVQSEEQIRSACNGATAAFQTLLNRFRQAHFIEH